MAWSVALTGMTIGTTVSVYRRLARRIGAAEIEWAAVASWWVLAMIVSVAVPGAGYLFVWPVLFAVVVAAFRPGRRWVALAFVSAPVIVLSVPAVDIFFQFGLPRPGNTDSQMPEIVLLLGLLVSLAVALLSPHFRMHQDRSRA